MAHVCALPASTLAHEETHRRNRLHVVRHSGRSARITQALRRAGGSKTDRWLVRPRAALRGLRVFAHETEIRPRLQAQVWAL
ncbi:MAG: hypothetical protein JNJ46_29315 [Myxococcales bacterium]|nr:hypothetical protein [Myxococcales bacterium]